MGKESETFRMPLARGLSMSESPVNGETVLTTRHADIRMIYKQRADGSLEKSLHVKTAKGLTINATLHEAAPFAWSRYSLTRDADLAVFQQTIGPSASRDVGSVGWTSSPSP